MKLKKCLPLLVAAAMCLTLAACGNGATKKSDAPKTEAPKISAAKESNASGAAKSEAGTAIDKNLSGSVTGSGSSALLPLAKKGVEEFKAVCPNISVTMNAGGSGTGLKQVSDGSVDIGNSDVFANKKLTPEKAAELVDHKVCTVTMAPIINSDVAKTVKNLSKQQMIDIFTAKTTNWKAVGGPDEPIVLITRPKTSGTRELFKEFALGGAEEASNAAMETDNSGTLLENVAQNKGAIGYVALSYLVTPTSGVSTVQLDGVDPTLENTYNGKYPVWGYEHMYTKGQPKPTVKAYLDFMTSDQFAKAVESMGYGVTAKMKVSR